MKKQMIFCVVATCAVILSSPSFSGPDCTCRYKGKDVAEGRSTCIKTANGFKVAKCSRVLNNTSWKFTQKACPVG